MRLRHASLEVLPALSIRQAELRRSMRLVTAAWAMGIIWMTCTGGSWMNTFQVMLGFTNTHFGLMTALPWAATLANLAAVVIIERTGLRKYVFIISKSISRMLWLVVALILVTLGGTRAGIWLVLLTILVSSVLDAVGTPAWMTWMGDLIPRRIRGRFLARRGMISRLVLVPVAIGVSIFIDCMTDPSKPVTPEAQPQLLWALAGLFVGSAFFGVADILTFLRIREVRPTVRDKSLPPAVSFDVAPPRRGEIISAANFAVRYVATVVHQLLIGPLKDHAFRRYVLYGATIAFAMGMGGSFYVREMREDLGLSHMSINVIYMILGPLMAIVSANPWGRLMDRWGRRPILMVATAVAVGGAVPYCFASRYTPNPPFVADAVNAAANGVGHAAAAVAGLFGWHVDWGHWLILGPAAPVGAWLICSTTVFFGFVGWSGVMLGQSGIIMGFADGAGRNKYVAAHAVFSGFGGAIGAYSGGMIADFLANASWYQPLHVGPFVWNNWHATFVLSTMARIAALLLLIGMPDPGARRARDMVRSIGLDMLNLLTGRMLVEWLGFGKPRGKRDGKQ
jgi:MFS family permease